MSEPVSKERIIYLRLEQVMERTALSKSSIYDKMNPKSARYDPQFPKQVRLGPAAVRWVESEVESWLASRLRIDGAPVKQVKEPIQPPKSHAVETAAQKSPLSLDVELHGKRMEIVQGLLVQLARRAERIYDEDLMAKMMLSPQVPGDSKIFIRILEEITRASHIENNLLLGALVKGGKAVAPDPEKAFLKLALALGYTYSDPEAFIEDQLVQMFEFYEDSATRGKGGLVWMKVGRKTFLTRMNGGS